MRSGGVFLSLVMLAGLPIAVASPAEAQGIALFAVLNGGNEVGATGQAAAGDPDGFGTASFTYVANDRICFAVIVHNVDRPTEMHIHEAVAGKEGPVRIFLTPPTRGNAGTSAGCVSGVSPALLARIRATPGNFYLNVHTSGFLEGAVRGQLF